MKNEIKILKSEIAKIQRSLGNYEKGDISLPRAMPKMDSVSVIPQTDGNFDSSTDGSTIISNDVDFGECVSNSMLSTATVLSPTSDLPPDDGTCVSCDAEYSGWEDFINKMKTSNYMCFGCFDYFPEQPWFRRSMLVEVDARCGSYLYLKQH